MYLLSGAVKVKEVLTFHLQLSHCGGGSTPSWSDSKGNQSLVAELRVCKTWTSVFKPEKVGVGGGGGGGGNLCPWKLA